jgi:hypothetical protein
MTAEEKVKQKYPNAYMCGYGSAQRLGIIWIIYDHQGGKVIGRCERRRRSWAWIWHGTTRRPRWTLRWTRFRSGMS